MASQLARLASRALNFLARRPATGGGSAERARGGLGRLASRARIDRALPERITPPSRTPPPLTTEQFLRQLERAARGAPVSRAEVRRMEEALGAFPEPPPIAGPPVQLPPVTAELVEPPPPPRGTAGDSGDEAYDEIQTLGRDYGYDRRDFEMLQQGQVEVSSSNVYSYYYQPESNYSGILYVTFLAPAPKGQPRTGPGPTYAYYDITRGKYERFRRDAEGSAGGAVWDHLRVRGTLWRHQSRYRLISVTGEYIPRRATFRGFRTRYLAPIGTPAERRAAARRGEFRRSTLPEELFDDGGPDRGYPDRGTPNRGR